MTSSLSALSLGTDATGGSEHAPDNYERACYYNGIAGDGDCPGLIYRSNYLTTPFPRPTGRFSQAPVKSIYGVVDTPLNHVWSTVGDQIRAIVKAAVPNYTCIDPARFCTYGPDGFTHSPDAAKGQGSLGPVTIWVGVPPGSTSADTAHDASQEILALLHKHDIDDVVVEWREAVLKRLSGPPLLRSTYSTDATYQLRHFLTNLLSIPVTTEGLETVDSSGTMTMFFHVVKDASGRPTDKVYGLTNCHVLRGNPKVDYEFQEGDDEDHVRVCSMRRFQRGLGDIMKAVRDALYEGELASAEHDRVEKSRDDSAAGKQRKRRLEQRCKDTNEDIATLKKFHDDVAQNWSNLQLQRNIGHVVFAPAIRVDVGGTRFTADWGVFEAAKAKFKDGFEGNVVFLGNKFIPSQLKEMFSRGTTEFKYPDDGKLRLILFASKLALDVLPERDSFGKPCLTVGKDGNTTDFTVGRFSGLESYRQNDAGVESMEYAVYNSGYNAIQPFSDKGDSGSVVWYACGDKAHIVGQLHSGITKDDDSDDIYVSYVTPGWWLEDEIRKKYPYADFFREAW